MIKKYCKLIFFIGLAAGLASLLYPAAAYAATSRAIQRYVDDAYSPENIDRRCMRNLGAGVDSAGGAKYASVCRDTYNKMREVAKKYVDREAKESAEIQRLTSQNASMCGGNRSSEGQRTCMETVAKDYDTAAGIKKELADALDKATKEVQELRKQNAKALSDYRRDRDAIDAAIREAEGKAAQLQASGDWKEAAAVKRSVMTSSTVSGNGKVVVASDGAAGSIRSYRQKIDGLAHEQEAVQKEADTFSSEVKGQSNQLQSESKQYSEMAKKIRAGIPSTVSLPDEKDVPIPTSRPPQQEIDAANAKRQLGSGSSQQGLSGGSKTQTNNSGTGPASTPVADNSTSSSTPSSSSSSMASNMAPMAGGAAASTGAASSSVGSPDPYGNMNNPAAYGNNPAQQQLTQQTPSSSKFGEVLGTHDPRAKNEDPQQVTAETEAEAEGTPEQVAAAGGLSGDLGENSGASSAPGVRGTDGKPIRTGFSAANGGGSMQSGRQSMDKDAAARDQFSPDLKSGAVSIAGSEMKSAMQSLAEELGATNLDLDLGDLTEEEKAALAPIEGGDGLRNLAPIKNGRRTAGLVQGSDSSIQDEQSVALFSRARSAHERALMRGNLILGIKKKF